MIHTKPEEIKLVKENIKVFEDRIPKRVLILLFNRQVRLYQHSLFFSLCNPSVYPHLLETLEAIKKYNKHTFFPKAISKLTRSSDRLGQQAAVAEVLAVGYYCKKFLGEKTIKVTWERKIEATGKKMDISLLGLSYPVNIEVTVKHEDERMRYHFDLRYKIKVAIEGMIAELPDQQYSYLFSIVTNKKNGETITTFSEKDISDFVEFIASMRRNGPGEYEFSVSNEKLATVRIQKLNKLKKEYAAHMDMWAGFLKDEKRIRNTIVDKAENQLPKDEINFVYLPSLSDFDEIDFQEAFLGKEQWHFRKDANIRGFSRKPDGVVQVISEKDFSPIYGLIWSGWDYAQKKVVLNPLLSVDEKVQELIA